LERKETFFKALLLNFGEKLGGLALEGDFSKALRDLGNRGRIPQGLLEGEGIPSKVI